MSHQRPDEQIMALVGYQPVGFPSCAVWWRIGCMSAFIPFNRDQSFCARLEAEARAEAEAARPGPAAGTAESPDRSGQRADAPLEGT